MNITALHARHRALNAKMTDFHGWEMPLYYSSIIEEHKAVRQALGIFDISHMGQVLVNGADALETLNRIMVSEISQVGDGRACYTLMLNASGGIVDDVIVYRIGSSDYLVVVNCANRESDLAWLKAHARGRTTISDISAGRSMLAVQGPRAAHLLEQLLDARVMGLGRFGIAPIRTMGPEACLARTGYTGGDGFELFVADQHARKLWDAVLSASAGEGGRPVGLGARDTLRIEAGLRLYGTDMDTETTPDEAGLGWTVAIHKADFIGKAALVAQRETGRTRTFVGFELAAGPVPRNGCELYAGSTAGAAGARVGTVTSGTFSPMLSKPLGMGYVAPACAKAGTALEMVVRGQRHGATVKQLPFWKGEPRQPVCAASVKSTLERLT